jgi:hypothetical protein
MNRFPSTKRPQRRERILNLAESRSALDQIDGPAQPAGETGSFDTRAVSGLSAPEAR